jgi:predicted DNA-binding protein (MmcQ/YjbR family)
MAKPKNLQQAEAALRDFALTFPGAVEEHPWDHIAIKVKGKMFLILGGMEDRLSVTTKLPSTGRFALLLPFASPTGYGLGKSGWVTGDFGAGDAVPVDRLCEWIEESYRAIAPKKAVAELDGVAAPAPKAKGKAKARKRKAK